MRTFDKLMTGAAFALVLAVAFGTARAETITRVVDGDTVRIGDERVRLRGIDTPELSRPRCREERRKAIEAKAALREIVEGRDVQVDRVGRDGFGRTLAVLRIDGVDVGSMLISRGLALPWSPGRADRDRRVAVWCGRSE